MLKRRCRRWTWVAAAAGLLLTAGVLLLVWNAPDASLAGAVDLRIERAGKTLEGRRGTALREGDRLAVGGAGWASIRYADGTTLELGPGAAAELGSTSAGKRLRLTAGRLSAEVTTQKLPMKLDAPHATAEVRGTGLGLAVTAAGSELWVRSGSVAFGGVEVAAGRRARAAEGRAVDVEPAGREALRRLGREHLMLGIMSVLGETWVDEVRAQGARFDLRYQHLSWNWTSWNKDGGFVPLYLKECEKLGVIPVFSYYVLSRPPTSLAAAAADEALMGRYFRDLLLFLRRAGENGKPLVLHVEPGLWEDPAPARVAVAATGLPELAGLDDTLSGFGRAFGILRDRHAPNVLLAWHASRREGKSARSTADELRRSGAWDLLFTDVGDRDAGYRESKGEAGAWWSEGDFEAFRRWASELHGETGLPLFVWRIPLGNRVMAACDNTPWHYMDNKAEYWLEGYPVNRRLAEWAAAGVAGFLFGGGTYDCKVHRDNAKDGATNPAPAPGNRGERSAFPDDDGGYLRLRAGAYYKAGPVPLPR